MIDNLNYYRVFLTVVEAGGISQAAAKLYISQPAVSKSISNLERELNVRLLDRSAHGAHLTEHGAVLYSNLKTAFHAIAEAETRLKNFSHLGLEELRIGVSTSLCKYVLMNYLKDFITEHPEIKISIDCHSSLNTIKLLGEEKLDLGLICKTSMPANLSYLHLQEIHDIFVTSRSYLARMEEPRSKEAANPWLFAGNMTSMLPSENGGSTDAEDTSDVELAEDVTDTKSILERSNLMLLEPENVTRKHIDRYLYEQNISPIQTLDINNLDLLADFASIGMGVSAVVKEFLPEEMKRSLVELPLPEPITPRSIGFAYQKKAEKNPALNLFLAMIESRIPS